MNDGQKPYISNDYGQSFTIATTFERLGVTPYFAVINSSGTTMLAASYDGYIYRSIDSGVNWFNTYRFTGTYTFLTCASASLDRIYVVVYQTTGPVTIYVSTDTGVVWNPISINPSAYDIMFMSCDWSGQNVVMTIMNDGVYRSTNGGEEWTQTAAPTGIFLAQIKSNSTGNRIIVSDGAYRIARASMDAGATWTILCTPDTPTNFLNAVDIHPDGTRAMSTSGGNYTYFQILGDADLPPPPITVPDAPSFTSPPTIVDATTIHIEYTLGFNGGSSLTNLQYAREEEGSYDTWISIPDLPSTIDGTSSINITGLTAPVTGNYKIRAVNNVGPSAASAAGLVEATIPCFLEGSKILCVVDGVEKYVAVETIRPGTLVKTSLNGYQPVKLIGSRVMLNAGGDKRDKNSLYLCTKANYPELTEDLIITGCHAILVDHITDVHRQGIIQTLERVFVTDKKYRLPACVDERAPVYQKTGTFTVWHFALEHTDIKMNYGVYAHGLLVETSPIWHMNTKNYRLVQ
jgi:hypothetical protein